MTFSTIGIQHRLFTLLLCVLLASNVSAQFNDGICVDGDYCPVTTDPPGNCADPAITDEWMNAATVVVMASSQSSCDVLQIWGAADLNNFYLALERGNEGSAYYYAYFNVDCDSLSGDVDHGGAEFRFEFRVRNSGNPQQQIIGLFEWDGASYTNPVTGGVIAKGGPDGCGSGPEVFVEMQFPLAELFDPCEDNDCGVIELAVIESQSGWSSNSNDCFAGPVKLQVQVNNPPTAVIGPIAPCIYAGVPVCFDGSQSSDPDGDQLLFEWDLSYDGMNFMADTVGESVCVIYDTPGDYTVALRVLDSFQCADTASILQFTVQSDVFSVDCALSSGLLCFDDSNGVLAPDITGGVPPFSYLWSDGQTDSIASNLAAGIYTVTVTDDSSCIATCTFELLQPDELIADCSVTADETCIDESDGSASVTIQGGIPPYDILWSNGATADNIQNLSAGVYSVTVSDSNGCDATCQLTISTTDTFPPVISCPADVVLNCPGDTTTQNTGLATAADDGTSQDVIISYQNVSLQTGNCNGAYSFVRRWYATDQCGYIDSCDQTIVVQDTTAPIITCPGDTVLNCPGDTMTSNTGIATATDECLTAPTISYTDAVIAGNCMGTMTITRTWTAMDACGNTSSCDQTIVVQDTTAPIITCPGDTVLNCPGDTMTSNTGIATATDECLTAPTITYADAVIAGNCAGTMTITRTWTATDACGNTSNCDQTIVVQDTTAPVLLCPSDTTLNCPGDTMPSSTGMATATDECLTDPIVTYSDATIAGTCAGTVTITRTWTATDACGNTSSCDQTIVVQDTTAPILTCPADTVLNCPGDTMPSSTGMATATDECLTDPIVTYSDATIAGTCAGTMTITRTWTATDACGNATSCDQMIVVQDTTAPVITCPTDTVLNCPGDTMPSSTGMATATDECLTAPTITYADAVIAGNCAGTMTITRRWTATDACGNVTSCDQLIVVQDTTPPLIVCPNDTMLTFPPDTSLISIGTATATDACDTQPVITYRTTVMTSDCDNAFTVLRTWYATDACGNVDSCIQTIVVGDPVAPIITCPADTVLNCPGDTSINSTGVATATDPNDPTVPTITYTNLNFATGDCDGTFSFTRRWYATDVCNNVDSCDQLIVVQDTTAPIITCPGDTVLNCPGDTMPSSTGMATATDECLTAPIITYTDVTIAGSCAGTMTITRTWTATDACGNASSCDQTIVVQDTTAPIITCPGDTILNCPGDTMPSSTGMATATDECLTAPIITYADVTIAGTCAGTMTITRTWTATDACGNASSCDQTIVVQDTTAPIITCPGDTVLNCPGDTMPSSTGMAAATDECLTAPIITYTDATIAGTCAGTMTITRTWTATDACGNASSCDQTIVVQDTTAPIITCPGDTVLNCPGDTMPTSTGMAMATDECLTAPIITYADVTIAGNCAGTMTITRTWTATDACGNASSCDQTIVVQDTTAPILTCPGDTVLNCPGDTMPSSTGMATATDECLTAPIITYADVTIAGNCSGTMTITRTWTATDACGNASSCDQMIVVQDTTAPIITCPADTVLNCPGDTMPSSTGMATATDECLTAPIITYADVTIAGTCSGTMTITRTWTATDACGNASSCDQMIVVQDTTAPIITCPGDTVLNCPGDTMPSSTGMATATDECLTAPIITYADVTIAGNCAGTMTITRTWTATDACGNASSCDQTIVVQDTTAPIITCPTDTVLNCPGDTMPSSTGIATATDECLTAPIIIYTDATVAGNCPGTMTITRTWTATDACGNASSCDQMIVVQDTMAPIITCPNDTALVFPPDTSVLSIGAATATDECDVMPTITYNTVIVSSDCDNAFTVLRTWYATDACGNVDSCVQTIVVGDPVAPIITCPADTVLNCPGDTSITSTGEATATDPNDPTVPIITYTNLNFATGNCDGAFSFTRRWYATDVCDNVDSCDQLIVVQDTTAPILTCPADTVLNCPGDTMPSSTGIATATDECLTAPIITYADVTIAGTCAGTMTITRTWTATDACGNASSCDQTIVVQDTTAPIITCPTDTVLNCPGDTMPSNTGMATATDECLTVPIVTYSDVTIAGTCAGTMTITRTWTATDACGNTSSCDQTIVVQDTTAPVITCPTDTVLNCPGDTMPSSTGIATATDECLTAPIITYSDATIAGNCAGTMTITRTWTATDACGNASSCDQMIVVQDTTAPIITCPNDTALVFPPDTSVLSLGIATATDECDAMPIITYNTVIVSSDCDNAFTVLRTWYATDACGNVDSCVQTITVGDPVAPVITCPADTVLNCPADTAIASVGVATAIDPNDPSTPPTISYTNINFSSGTCAGTYSFTRRWYATDACDNIDSCDQLIVIQDTTAPTIICPADTVLDCPADTSPQSTGIAIAMDECLTTPVITYSDQVLLGDCDGDFMISRTWYATDACGNVSQCVQSIRVQDTIPPVINCPPNVNVECDTSMLDPLTFDEFLVGPGISDACCIDPSSFAVSDSILPGPGISILRTYSISDCCGNEARCTQSLSLLDVTPPMAMCRDTICVMADSLTRWGYFIIDSVDAGSTDNCGLIDSIALSVDSLFCDIGVDTIVSTTVLYVWDAAGNIDSCEATVKVICPLFLDLALTKTSVDTNVWAGDTLVFDITVYNQGTIGADSISIVEFIPAGFSLLDPLWIPGTSGSTGVSAMRIISIAGGELPPDGLTAGQEVTIPLMLMAAQGLPAGAYVNRAEIYRVVHQLGVNMDEMDIDSYPDDDDTNDGGGLPGGNSDDAIDGDGLGDFLDDDPLTDEDDHDPHLICLMPEPQLSGEEFVCPQDTFTYTLTPYNPVNQYTWSLPQGGGVIIGSDSSQSVTIFWNGTPGETFDLVLEEDTGYPSCRGVAVLPVTIQADLPIVCHAHLNITLDQNCEYLFDAQIGIVAPPYGNDAYIVVIYDENGDLIPGNLLTSEHIGQTITFEIRNECYTNMCWGYALIEDKLGPELVCANDTISCSEPTGPLDIGLPDSTVLVEQVDSNHFIVDGIDNCGLVDLTYYDVDMPFSCNDNPYFLRGIYRHWKAVDGYGNVATCIDSIFIEPINLDTFPMAPDRDGFDQPTLACQGDWDVGCDGLPGTGDNGEGDGIPQPCEIGDEMNGMACRLWITYSDEFYDLCSGSQKIKRKWTIADECRGGFKTYMQHIIIEDKEAPMVSSPDTITVTSGDDCLASWQVVPPTISDVCSDETSWRIRSSAGLIANSGGDYLISELPHGAHELYYIGQDACGNRDTSVTIIVVQDLIAPVVICDQNTTISLINNGEATLSATSLDDGSFDNCGIQSMAVRRADADCWSDQLGPEVGFCCDDLGLGPIMVELVVTDVAGNSNSCWVAVVVDDKTDPSIVAPPDITISCGYDYDMGDLSEFGRVVNESNGEVRSAIQIADQSYVEQCLNQIYTGPNDWGMDGYVVDNCNVQVSESTSIQENCGIGQITRVFTATDADGGIAQAVQHITIQSCDIFTILDTDSPCRENNGTYTEEDDVDWPCSIVLSGCTAADISPANTGRPFYTEAACQLLADTFKDEVYTMVPDACFKILRRWRVIDWCQMNPTTGEPASWEYVQEIKVIDESAPEIMQSDIACMGADTDCTVDVLISPDVTDCTPQDLLDYTWRIDIDNDASGPLPGGFDQEGATKEIPITLAYGSHRVLWTIADMCGNTSSKEFVFEVEDCTKPRAVCTNGISSILLPVSGELEIWATDLNASSSDNCSAELSYRVYYPYMDSMSYPDQSANWHRPTQASTGADVLAGLPESMIVYCAAIEDTAAIDVEMYVVDDAGNWDFCTMVVTVDDLMDVCSQSDSAVNISGAIRTSDGVIVDETMMYLIGESDDMDAEKWVNDDGEYRFTVDLGYDWSIRGDKSDDFMNGVTAQDLSIFHRHLVGLDLLTDPYDLVAGDANGDRALDVLDIVEFRKLILGIQSTLPISSSWRMLDADYIFPGITSYELPDDVYSHEILRRYDLMNNSYQNNLIAVKVGDFDGDASANSQGVNEDRSGNILSFDIMDKLFEAGEIVEVDLYAKDIEVISAYQMNLNFDNKTLEFIQSISGALPIDEKLVGTQWVDRGLLTTLWYELAGGDRTSDEPLFTLQFMAHESGRLSDHFRLGTTYLDNRAFSDALGNLAIEFRFIDEKADVNSQGFVLYQNNPNPWSDETVIGFTIPEASDVFVEVYGLTGEILWTTKLTVMPGYNKITLDKRDIPTINENVLFYRLTSDSYQATKKMLFVK